jgi:RND family efflux transporter MFP subunit
VDVTASAAMRAPTSASYVASVVSEREADVATRISGTVRAVHVELGRTVRAGEPLVTLDDRDIAARVRAARAALDLAETHHGRIERLAADGVASRQELDRSTSALEAARSALAEAEAQESYAVVRAPFAGLVTSRNVDPGDLANPGAPLVTIVDPSAIKIVADLPANQAGTLAIGDPVTVEIAGAERPVTARIVRVVPAFGGGSRTFRVEAHPDEAVPGVYPGAYARVRLPRDAGAARWIPEDALVERGQLRGVFSVEGDVVRLRWVRVGERRGGAVELLSGPAGDLTVVRRPDIELTDGRAVSSVRSEAWSPPAESTAGGFASGETTR